MLVGLPPLSHPHPDEGHPLKHLTIIYNPGSGPVQLFDGPVEELVWSDSTSGVRVEGKVKGSSKGSAGLVDFISAASKHKTAVKRSEQ